MLDSMNHVQSDLPSCAWHPRAAWSCMAMCGVAFPDSSGGCWRYLHVTISDLLYAGPSNGVPYTEAAERWWQDLIHLVRSSGSKQKLVWHHTWLCLASANITQILSAQYEIHVWLSIGLMVQTPDCRDWQQDGGHSFAVYVLYAVRAMSRGVSPLWSSFSSFLHPGGMYPGDAELVDEVTTFLNPSLFWFITNRQNCVAWCHWFCLACRMGVHADVALHKWNEIK